MQTSQRIFALFPFSISLHFLYQIELLRIKREEKKSCSYFSNFKVWSARGFHEMSPLSLKLSKLFLVTSFPLLPSPSFSGHYTFRYCPGLDNAAHLTRRRMLIISVQNLIKGKSRSDDWNRKKDLLTPIELMMLRRDTFCDEQEPHQDSDFLQVKGHWLEWYRGVEPLAGKKVVSARGDNFSQEQNLSAPRFSLYQTFSYHRWVLPIKSCVNGPFSPFPSASLPSWLHLTLLPFFPWRCSLSKTVFSLTFSITSSV